MRLDDAQTGDRNQWVLVYDTDQGNPYGREIGRITRHYIFGESARPCEYGMDARDNLDWRIFPSTGRSFILAQAFRQLRGLAALVWAAFVGRGTIVVVLTRSWYDELSLALAAVLSGRLIVVAHDPYQSCRSQGFGSLAGECCGSMREYV